METIINSLQESINEACVDLHEYRYDYLDIDSVNRIIENCKLEEELYKLNIGKTIYEHILKGDSSPEYLAGYIAGLEEAIKLLTNNK